MGGKTASHYNGYGNHVYTCITDWNEWSVSPSVFTGWGNLLMLQSVIHITPTAPAGCVF